jgi:amino acid adenylation domain-containing protein
MEANAAMKQETIADQRNHAYALSPYQELFWFLNKNSPGSCLLSRAYRFKIKPDLAHIQQCAAHLTSYAILRTRIEKIENRFIGRILDDQKPDFKTIRCRQRDLSECLNQEANQPFDLEKDLRFRTRVFITEKQEYYLLLSCHHILLDLYSAQRYISEFIDLLKMPELQEANPPPHASLAYLGSLHFEMAERLRNKRHNLTRFWSQHLNGTLNLPVLPQDHFVNNNTAGFRGRIPFSLPDWLAHSVRERAKEYGVTPFVLLLAVFKILLYKYGNHQPFTTAIPVSMRTGKKDFKVLSCMLNTIPLKLAPSGEERLSEFVRRLDTTWQECLAHKALPVLEMRKLVLDAQRTQEGLYNTLFSFQRIKGADISVAGEISKSRVNDTLLSPVQIDRVAQIYLLNFTLVQTNTSLGGFIEFNQSHFQQRTINRLCEHYKNLLKQMVLPLAHERTISSFSIVSDKEKQRILADSAPVSARSTETDYLNSIIHTFQAHPERQAIKDNSGSYTFFQTVSLAAGVVKTLLQNRKKEHEPVALLCHSGFYYISALLGILMSNKIVMPIDPETPVQRVQTLLHKSRCKTILSAGSPVQTLKRALPQTTIIDIAQIKPEAECTPRFSLYQRAPSYILFTSGSTGEPKGVIQTHGCLHNLITFQMSVTQARKKILQYAPIGFDVSLQEMLFSLASAGTLYCFPKSKRLDFAWLSKFIIDQKIEILFMPFTALKLLTTDNPLLHDSHLRYIIQAGEAMHITPDLNLLAQKTGCTIMNQYGPTETHVVTQEIIPPEKCHKFTNPSIGKALPGTALYILDHDMQLVPNGIPGELYVGGPHVAIGYLNEAESAKAFIKSPFQSGQMLYRTGDMVKRLENDSLVFIGRKDQQLKIRGFRVEPKEIETVLAEHRQIENVCITSVSRAGEMPELVGYIQSDHDIKATQIRAWLRERLPAYMIPSRLCLVETFPLTPSNKIDKKRLPDPFKHGMDAAAIEPPQSGIEHNVHTIWCEILKIDSVSVENNFFECGGHSLSAIQVINRINDRFDIELSVNILFQNPTIREISQHIDSIKTNKRLSVRHDLGKMDTTSYIEFDTDGATLYPLSGAQRMIWFMQQLDPGNYVYNMPTCLKITGSFDTELFSRALFLLIKNYDILRTIFVTKKNQPFQKILPPESISIQSYIQRVNIPDKVDAHNFILKYSTHQSRKPFALDQGPLLKIIRFESSTFKNRCYIFVNIHHIIADGWGIRRIMDILASYYEQLLKDKQFRPAPPVLQYHDTCLWQVAKHKELIPPKQKLYWKNKLAKGLPRNHLPADRPRPRVKRFDGKQKIFEIETPQYHALTTLAGENGLTLFSLLLAIVKIIVHKLTDDRQITVGIPTEGRNRTELENQPGLFINTIISTDTIDPQQSFIGFAKNVFDTLANDLKNKAYPFDQLVADCVKEHDLSHNPITDILISHHRPLLAGISFGNAYPEQIDLLIDKSRVDLSLVFIESRQYLKCILEYNKSIFNESRMERLTGQLLRLIKSATSHPNERICELEMIPENELDILKGLAYRHKPFDLSSALATAFRNQVETTPDRIAVQEDEKLITYAVLDDRVKRIKGALSSIVDRSEVIGVFLPRSVDFVVSLWGILDAGYAMLPIDPALPQERIRHMLLQSGCKIVITNSTCIESLKFLAATVTILDIETSDALSPATHYVPVNPTDKAFILFTSGTSGRPKGIMITHRNMYSFCNALKEILSLGNKDKFLHHTALSFDAAIMEIVFPLLFGITLVIANNSIKHDPDRLLRFIKSKGITIAFFTPSLIKLLGFERIASIKNIISGGEPALADDGTLAKYGCRYINAYGPAETTMGVTCYPVCRKPEIREIPLGQPLWNNEILILDEHLCKKPVGVVGEIFVGGDQVSLGYINDPRETAKRFIPHPFRKGEKLYRTGDLAMWGEDGNLYFRGRLDKQVKIRGIRIEPDEIRQVLLQSGLVKDAVITIRKQELHQEILCYYVADSEIDPILIRTELRKYIYDGVIPNRFIQIDKVPLNMNGKINFRALPEPVSKSVNKKKKQELSETACRILKIWEETLQSYDIDPDTSFFEMGGNSLLIVALQNKLCKAFAIKLEIADLFQFVTIREMARKIDEIIAQTPTEQPDNKRAGRSRTAIKTNQRQKRLQSRARIYSAKNR